LQLLGESIIERACLIFIKIYNEQIFNDLSYEIAIFLFNNLVGTNGYLPLIFCEMSIPFFEENKLNSEKMKTFIINHLYNYTADKNKIQPRYSFDDLKANLELLKSEDFNIESLYVFGSYAANECNDYSDLDIAVYLKEKIVDEKERSLLKGKIVDYLQMKLNIRTDLHFFGYPMGDDFNFENYIKVNSVRIW
jgi:predicted nucleotidyltransferase